MSRTARVSRLLLAGLLPLFAADHNVKPHSPEVILTRMEQRWLRQVEALESYQGQRRYSVTHRLLSQPAYWLVQEQFSSPGEKRLTVLERGGSSIVQKRVFGPLLEVERETARAAVRPQVDLSRKNYAFTFLRYDDEADAYVFSASPRGDNPYLLRGIIWVNAEDFGVQRIEGEPARKHSTLIRSVHFVHEFARFGEFWLPVRHRSVTELYLLGRATLEIDYFNYRWQATPQGGQP